MCPPPTLPLTWPPLQKLKERQKALEALALLDNACQPKPLRDSQAPPRARKQAVVLPLQQGKGAQGPSPRLIEPLDSTLVERNPGILAPSAPLL